LRKRLVGYDAVNRLQRAAAFVCLAFGLLLSPITAADAETRSLKLYNTHTKEKVSVTFKKNGRYIPSGLREANRFLRDWRRNEMTKIDPELLDLIWEVYQKVRARDHIYVVSSYRSPATNNMLRKRSKGVAKNSQHTLGKAMDFYIPGVKLSKLRAAGLRKEVGGVGYYPRSGSPFVHMDTGRVRHWPRMSRSQLVKVFPNGKTLHIPSDGKPLKGYKIALAEAKSGKKRKTRPTLVASAPQRPARTNEQKLTNTSNNSGQGGGNILSNLFRSNNNTESAERSRVAAVRPDRANVPPGALPGVKRSGGSSPAGRNAPAVTAPPIPADKDRVVLAGIVPAAKPVRQPVQVASAAPARNTLDAQRVALENGGASPSASVPVDGRFDVAATQPSDKPMDRLIRASQQAALQRASVAGSVPVPQQAPALDPVSAIAAATGSKVPSAKPAPPATLAYASATALPAALKQRAKAAQNGFSTASISNSRPKRPVAAPSVSGRIPMNEIEDPLAGFAGLPDKSESKLISGQSTTRHRHFADLRHPHQRTMDKLLAPGNRFVRGGFEKFPYGSLRTDRFDGPAVIILPVTFAR
jgi:uncharacterized protein YcbK (DUF882 family)